MIEVTADAVTQQQGCQHLQTSTRGIRAGVQGFQVALLIHMLWEDACIQMPLPYAKQVSHNAVGLQDAFLKLVLIATASDPIVVQ